MMDRRPTFLRHQFVILLLLSARIPSGARPPPSEADQLVWLIAAPPQDVEITVRDSTSEVRWFVLPERPVGTEHLSEAELVPLVTRDAMVGVAKVVAP